MNNCEEILMQKLALLDGEKTELSAEKIDAHLAACENCRRSLAQFENTVLLLSRQQRNLPDTDLWPAVEERIAASETPFKWQPFVWLAALLVVYKLLEMLPERDLGWALKLVPLVLIAVAFGFVKENPFKINTELILEK